MIKVRQAIKTDSQTIARIILEAESTGYELTSYAQMFKHLDKTSIIEKLSNIISLDTKGHPLSYSTYYLVEFDNQVCGGLSAYIEGEHGNSNHLITGALMTGFSRAEISDAFGFLKTTDIRPLNKTIGSLQLDCVAIFKEYRGLGLFKSLLQEVENKYSNLGVNSAEIQVWTENKAAIKVYKKCDYDIFATQKNANSLGQKIIMQKQF